MKKLQIQIVILIMLMGISMEYLQASRPTPPPKPQKLSKPTSASKLSEPYENFLARTNTSIPIASATHNLNPQQINNLPQGKVLSIGQTSSQPAPPSEPRSDYLARKSQAKTLKANKSKNNAIQIQDDSAPVQYSKSNLPPAPSTPAPLEIPIEFQNKTIPLNNYATSGGSLHAQLKAKQGADFVDPAVQRTIQKPQKPHEIIADSNTIKPPNRPVPPRPTTPPGTRVQQKSKNHFDNNYEEASSTNPFDHNYEAPQSKNTAQIQNKEIAEFSNLTQKPGSQSYLQAASNAINNAVSKLLFNGNTKKTTTIKNSDGTISTRVETYSKQGKLVENKITTNKKTLIAKYNPLGNIEAINIIKPGSRKTIFSDNILGQPLPPAGQANKSSYLPVGGFNIQNDQGIAA